MRAVGDAAVLAEAGPAPGAAASLAAAIAALRLPGVTDIVPGAATVLVITEPGSTDQTWLARRIGALLAGQVPAAPAAQAAPVLIPVCYDGPDLTEVAGLTGLSPDEVITRHQAAEYQVGWLGFAPGFGYLPGLDPVLAQVPRLATPRQRVPAGSVAIAGGLTAVYPSASPGGWRLIGRTTARLWDSDREPPALFAPGMPVRFRAVSAAELAPERPARALAEDGPGARSTLEIVRPGPLTTVQDLGRTGYAHLGVPHAGAADLDSLRLANRLVGNPDGAAGLEFTLGQAVLRFHASVVIALTGAPAPASVEHPSTGDARAEPDYDGPDYVGLGTHLGSSPDDVPAARREVPPGEAVELPAGAVLRLRTPPGGLRTYLAVRGGIDVPAVLGSRSADLLSGLGQAPLRAGDRLPVGPAPRAARPTPPPSVSEPPDADGAAILRVIAGPRDDWFEAAALELLASEAFRVTPVSNRTGLRLSGPALPRARAGELPSEGMVAGALQVPPDGQPILLLADHPATGGYPVIAVLRTADIGRAAQLRPGQLVRFAVSPPP
jgi:KipI family sensor histidine kinase inhibitor